MGRNSRTMAALVVGCALLPAGWTQAGGSPPPEVSRQVVPGLAASMSPDKTDIPFDASLVEDLADGHLDTWTLADAALVASGIDNAGDLTLYRARLQAVLTAATAHVNRQASPARRARRLLEELHRVALRKYEASSDRFTDLLDSGVYNCVSASLLYIIAARQVGLDPAAGETPLHVFVVLQSGDRDIEIEATSPSGFDVQHDLIGFRTFVLANKYVTPEELALRGVEAIFNEFNNLTRPVTPEHAISFLYHNAGIRALHAGDASKAARCLIDAVRIYPDLGYRSDDLRKTLAWSVREQYDAGNYLGAFRVAEVSMKMFPDRTTVTDRFVAVAARVVEDAAGRGDMAAADDYEARTMALLPDAESRRRLEAYTAPLMARAYLLARDWPAARRHAARFSASSSDPVEAERFMTWVEGRVLEGSEGVRADAFEEEVKAALAAVPPGQDPHDYAAVVRGIASLAERGRYDEALAVGKVQRAAIAADGGAVVDGAALDTLLRAVAGGQVATLLREHRWKDAGPAVARALAQWPGDSRLLALRDQTRTVMVQDPWRVGAWPRTNHPLAGIGPLDTASARAGKDSAGVRR